MSSILISVGHVLLSVNGSPVTGNTTEDGRDVFEIIEKKVNLKTYYLLRPAKIYLFYHQ